MQFSTGSFWRKWDLHVHTPASFHWGGSQRLHEITDQDAIDVINAMNETDVDVFAIQDYWTFDGYFKIKQIVKENPAITEKTIFPGIELRIESPIKRGRLNVHVIFSNELSDRKLLDFLAHLKVRDVKGGLSKETIIESVRTLMTPDLLQRNRGKNPKELSDEDAYIEGCEWITITQDSLENALSELPENSALVMFPFSPYNGLKHIDLEENGKKIISFMRLANVFEEGKKEYIDSFLNKKTEDNKRFIQYFQDCLGGSPKPCVRGSDAHSLSDYGKFHKQDNQVTWIRANPSFQGLLQVLNQPDRAFIGDMPSQISRVENNKTKHIRKLEITKNTDAPFAESWFPSDSMNLNSGLIIVLGNKGSGKSALVDILGKAGNSYREQSDFSFLKKEKFANKRSNLAQWFDATITWHDGNTTTSQLDNFVDVRTNAEKVLYVPQHFFEKICNETELVTGGAFDEELKKVIFSHVSTEQRSGYDNLDNLIDYLDEEAQQSIKLGQNKLRHLNEKIVDLQDMLLPSHKQQLEAELAEKKKERDAITDPEPVPAPTNNDDTNSTKIDTVREEQEQLEELVSDLKSQQMRFDKRAISANKLISGLANLQAEYDQYETQYSEIAEQLDVDFEKLAELKINSVPVEIIRDEALEKSDELKEQISNLNSDLQDNMSEIERLQEDLDQEHRAYQAYLSEIAEKTKARQQIIGDEDTQGTITYIQSKVDALRDIPEQILELEAERKSLVREIYESVEKLFLHYKEIMRPVQEYISAQELEASYQNVEIDINMELNHQFASSLLDLVNQRRKGMFQGNEEGQRMLDTIIERNSFDDFDQIWEFIQDILNNLRGTQDEVLNTNDTPLEPNLRVDIADEEIRRQLNSEDGLVNIYQKIFGLDYIRPNYVFKLDGKNLIQLSPGERGILLLIFYLLVDMDDRPLIIDQPEENLDNQSIEALLVPCFKKAKERRQIIIVTHNPNITVGCDADQVIYASMNKDKKEITYVAGAIENPDINATIVEIQEGTWPAFEKRGNTYIRV